MDTPSPLEVQVSSSIQVFPELRQADQVIVPLSIIDNTVSYFARCSGIWFYDPPSNQESALSSGELQTSLSKTLQSYRPWCGRLSYAKPIPKGGHTNRYRRVHVTYNAPTDLGVTLITATSPKKLSDFIPSVQDRKSALKAWDASQIDSGGLLPKTQMALASPPPPPDAPNCIIQFTTFACGSSSIAIALAHGLSDAQSMCTFAKDWASTNRALHASAPLPNLSPVLNPRLLDAAALGDIDAEDPDQSLISQARNLPLHRFDWYKQVPGYGDNTPSDFDHSAVLSPSDPIPWNDWDMTAPSAGRVLHFTPDEIQLIYEQASTDPSSKISKHDAILAHVWALVNRARQLPSGTVTYLDLTFGLRPRLSLPQNFLGSPIMLAAIPWTISATIPSLSSIAANIRTHLATFTPQAIGAFLHDAAFEYSPQRLWQAFLGSKHILQTTWAQSGFQDVDFIGEGGGNLMYVQPEMGGDGLLLVMEALGEKKGQWTANGVDVHLYLNREVMERFLKDPNLWGEGV